MTGKMDRMLDAFRVPPGKKINLLKDYDPGYVDNFFVRKDAETVSAEGIRLLAEQQDKLYAQDNHAVLIVLQAMDAAGKDSTIKHVMSGVNPQGVQVTNFVEPSIEELDHDYLWRITKALPRRGTIGIFDRSHYEEVLVVRVHPEYLDRQRLPLHLKGKDIWARRYNEINCFEKYLTDNGVVVLKIFLNVSREEQKKRFLERVHNREKNWKFSAADIHERKYWDAYMDAYQDMLNATSTSHAPWYIVPANHKWFTRLAVTSVINATLKNLNLAYPQSSVEEKEALLTAKKELERER
jgi:PPK2 family polyphosphate:nucleotide phosphotransferase